MPLDTQTVELKEFRRKGEVRAQSVDEAARTVELVWTTGAEVLRHHWERGTYMEALAVTPEALMLDRLNNSAPLLNSHQDWTLRDVIGVVVPGSVRIEGGKGYATVRFSEREEVEAIWKDVRSGILTKVSVGYRVHVFEVDETQSPPRYTATRWEPYELSMVGIAADDGAGVRSETTETHPCVIQRAVPTNPQEETPMSKDVENKGAAPQAAPQDETRKAAPATETVHQPDLDAVRREAAEAERKRASEIRSIGAKLNLDDAVITKAVNDGATVDQARAAFIDAIAAKSDEEPATRSRITINVDEVDTRRAAVAEAIEHRLRPRDEKGQQREISEHARQFRGQSLLEVGKELLTARGVNVRGMSRMEIAGQMASRAHSTSDFPFILANVAGKRLRQAYGAAPQTFRPIVNETTLPDFKQVSRVQIGEAPSFLPIIEGAEYKFGTVGESREVYNLVTYGRGLKFTRQMIINDDLSAFDRMVGSFGASARNLESDIVWGIVTANANMADGVALFAAGHGNLATAGAISVANLGAGKALMRKQTALDGETLLNIEPEFLVVPAELETLARQYTSSAFQPESSANINVVGVGLSPIVEPRLASLNGGSADDWYLFASPSVVDTIEVAYLEGESGPVLEMDNEFTTDAIAMKGRLDFGAKAIDWRGMVKNPGS